MKKLKIFAKWFLKVGISTLLIIFLITAPLTLFPNLQSLQANVNKSAAFEYEGILELWHIETFEGGSVSRANFLEKQAIAFEKKHKGSYIVIESMSLEQFKLNLANGKKPDMLSFGIGIGDGITDSLIDLNDVVKDVRSDLLVGGRFGTKQLAVPYLLGGYAIISKSEKLDNINGITGTGLVGANNSLYALKTNNIKISIANTSCDTFNAYDQFLKGNFQNLLGTQRDVYRIWNRQQKGVLNGYKYFCLSGYTDLVQYVSVINKNLKVQKMCKYFVNQLIGQDAQQDIAQINMFSVLKDKKVYTTDIFCDMEKALSKSLNIENVFLNLELIDANKQKLFKEYI